MVDVNCPIAPARVVPHADSRVPATPTVPSQDPIERDLAVARFFSPVTRLDVDTQKAVLLYRDKTTGEVIDQIPSRKKLEAYAKADRDAARKTLSTTEDST